MAQTNKQIISAQDLALTQLDHLVSPVAFSSNIRALMQNWRQGTVGCKDRSEVSFSNKKPWKQKGTGRARAGSPRSPLWRKGGVVFGPQLRVRTLKVSKNLKRSVLHTLLLGKLAQGGVISLQWSVAQERPKTALAYQALRDAGLHDKKVVFFVSVHDYVTHASFANIPTVRMLLFDQPNAYALADAQYWVFLQKDSDLFKEMVNRWI